MARKFKLLIFQLTKKYFFFFIFPTSLFFSFFNFSLMYWGISTIWFYFSGGQSSLQPKYISDRPSYLLWATTAEIFQHFFQWFLSCSSFCSCRRSHEFVQCSAQGSKSTPIQSIGFSMFHRTSNNELWRHRVRICFRATQTNLPSENW